MHRLAFLMPLPYFRCACNTGWVGAMCDTFVCLASCGKYILVLFCVSALMYVRYFTYSTCTHFNKLLRSNISLKLFLHTIVRKWNLLRTKYLHMQCWLQRVLVWNSFLLSRLWNQGLHLSECDEVQHGEFLVNSSSSLFVVSLQGVCNEYRSCSCFIGYTPTPTCTPVCSGGCGQHGTCTAPDVCTCANGWQGVRCDVGNMNSS